MMEDKQIDGNIYVCYDPHEEEYFLENRNPWDWATSVDYYATEKQAEVAYFTGKVKWE
jgi:hypothetical protein